MMIFCRIESQLGNIRRFSTSNSLSSTTKSSNYCLDLVRRRDHEHFLTNLLLPKEIRSAAFVLRALNAEVSSVRDQVSDPNLGRMRLLFWKDTIRAIYAEDKGAVPKHPVAIELESVVHKHQLSRDLLERLITSRENRLTDKPFLNIQEVEKYSEDSVSSLNYLILETYFKKEENQNIIKGHARHVANHLGKAEGIVTMIRAVPHNASRRLVVLPSDLMGTHKISSESVIRGSAADDEKFRHIVEVLAAKAEEHLENARFRQKFLSREEKLMMLPSVIVDSYLSRLEKAKCNVFDPALQKRDSWLPINLFVHKLKRSY